MPFFIHWLCFTALLFVLSFNFEGQALSPNLPAKRSLAKEKTPVPKQWVQLKKELKKRRNRLFSPILQRRLDRLYRTLKKDKKKALTLIESLEKIVQNRPFEQAKLYLLKAQVYLSLEKPKKAMLYYQKAKDSQKLSYREHLSLLHNMAYLYLMNKNLGKAEEINKKLFFLSESPPPPSLYILKAFILIEKNQKKQALKQVQLALKISRNPKEYWLALGAGLHLELKNYVPAIKLLSKLTAMKPQKQEYWKQLSSAYLNVDKNHKALATLDLAYKMDFLKKESEIWHLASLLDAQGLPFKAAILLETALKNKKVKSSSKNHELIGGLWQRAEEGTKALKHYQKSAVFAQDGKIFAKMARLHRRARNWKAMANNIKKALEKGGIPNPENLYIALGTAYVKLNQSGKALKAFESVMEKTKAKTSHIKQAREWILYVQKLEKP